MKKNLINVVIPTRNRPDTLYYCLKTVVNQDYNNLRIIVNNNSDIYRNETKEVVKSFKDKRINYFETEGNLAMKDNYEDALNKVTDGYVMYIGDDDGITYNSINYINNLINETNLLAYRCFSPSYRWKKTFENFNIKSAFAIFKNTNYTIMNSKKILKEVCKYMSFPITNFLPNIYCGGVISLELINKIKKKSNSVYFQGVIPDIYSSIINCSETKEYVLFFNPIIITGISKHSTGISIVKSNSISNKIKNENNKIKNEFLNQNTKYNLNKLSYSSLNICLFDSITEAQKYIKNIPKMNIKKLINEVIIYELNSFDNSSKSYKLIIEDLIKISKNYDFENYLYKKLKIKNFSNNKNNTYIKKTKYTVNTEDYSIENIFDISIFCNSFLSNKNNFIEFKKNDKKYQNNVFNLNNNNFIKNKKTICITSLEEIEIVKYIPYNIMLTNQYNEDNYYKLKNNKLISFSIKELKKYYNIIFLDFKSNYFNKILIHLENKCFIFPKNKYITNYKYLLDSVEIEDLSFIKNYNDILNLE